MEDEIRKQQDFEKEVEKIKADLFSALDAFYFKMGERYDDYTFDDLKIDVEHEIRELKEYVEGGTNVQHGKN